MIIVMSFRMTLVVTTFQLCLKKMKRKENTYKLTQSILHVSLHNDMLFYSLKIT